MATNFMKAIEKQRKTKVNLNEEISTLDYLSKVKENPDISRFAPGRVYNMIIKHGTEDLPMQFKTKGYDDIVKYNFFDGKIFGTYESIHDLMRFLKAAANRTETGKRIMMMVGPVASGKSTISALLKRGLEKDDTSCYAIKGCQMHEEPLHLIPEEDREFWNKELGVKIEGNLCPKCQQMIDEHYTNEDGTVRWEEVPVERVLFSENKRSGIGTFAPSDPKSQDVSELIGRVNMSKIAHYGETDPRAFEFNGELHVANRGMIEYIEILKADIKFHYILLSVAQEQLIKSPGFPQTHLDTVILSHTNQTEYDSFKGERKNEALHDRIYPVYFRYNLRVDDEIKIYKKMISESSFANMHIDPYALKLAAQVAVISRLKETPKCNSLIDKMKLYNDEIIESFEKEELDVRELYEEGRESGEGMFGLSPRFIINALNIALQSRQGDSEKGAKNCISTIDLAKALIENFNHSLGIPEEDISRFKEMIIGDKESIINEYKEVAKEVVNMSFMYAYKDQANELFNRYMENARAFCMKEKLVDMVTGNLTDPDEQLMRSLEELIPVPENGKKEFRNQIFVFKSNYMSEKKEFTFEDYKPLTLAIRKKLMSDLKNLVALTIVDTTNTNPKKKKEREKAFQNLLNNGYCEHCANTLLGFVANVMRKE